MNQVYGFTATDPTTGQCQTMPGFGPDRDAARDNLRTWLDTTGRAHWTVKD